MFRSTNRDNTGRTRKWTINSAAISTVGDQESNLRLDVV